MAHENVDTSGAVRLGLLAASGFTVFIAVAVVLHFVQPELHPSRRFISEYAAGSMGWLLNAGFAFFAVGLSALAMAFGWRPGPLAGTRVGGASPRAASLPLRVVRLAAGGRPRARGRSLRRACTRPAGESGVVRRACANGGMS